MKIKFSNIILFTILIVVLLVYIAACFIVYPRFIDKIENSYIDIAQASTRTIVQAIKSQFTMTDEEIETLLSIEYKDLPANKTNVRFEKIVRSIADDNPDIRYGYIMFVVPEKNIKYHVEKNEEGYYQTQAGKPLDTIWLLNVNLDNTRYDTMSSDIIIDKEYLNDKNRYSYLRDYDIELYDNEQSGTNISDDEYGKQYISGLTPLYTTGGKFAGMIGIDIFLDNYFNYIKQIKIFFQFIFTFMTLFLVGLLCTIFFSLYNRNNTKKTKDTSTLIDTITGVYNISALTKFENENIKPIRNASIPITVIKISLINLTELTERYGQDKVNIFLASIGAAIKNHIRMPQDFPLYYNEDEFVVIFTHLSPGAVEKITYRILDNIKAANKKMKISDVDISFGMASMYTNEKISLSNLIENTKTIANL